MVRKETQQNLEQEETKLTSLATIGLEQHTGIVTKNISLTVMKQREHMARTPNKTSTDRTWTPSQHGKTKSRTRDDVPTPNDQWTRNEKHGGDKKTQQSVYHIYICTPITIIPKNHPIWHGHTVCDKTRSR